MAETRKKAEETVPTPTPRPASAKHGWAPWVGAGLMGLGAAVSISVALALRDSPPPKAPVLLPEESAQAPNIPFPNAEFARLQAEVAGAETPEQKVPAGLAMVEFLRNAQNWRTETERYRMAREYALALAEHPLEISMRFRVARHLLELARVMQDAELLAAGSRLMRAEPAEEPIPFDLLCAEADGLIELGDPAEAYVRIDELGARAEGNGEPCGHLLRVVRGLRRALDHEAALQALQAHRKAGDGRPGRDDLLSELTDKAGALASCGSTDMEAESLWHQAYLARLRDAPDEEIGLLQQIVAKGMTPFRAGASMRLADLYRDQQRDMDHAQLLSQIVGRPELREFAQGELYRRLLFPATEEVARELLLAVDQVVGLDSETSPALAQLLVAASQMAIWQKWLPQAEQYLGQIEAHTLDREVLADSMYIRAGIAEANGQRQDMIRAYKEVLGLYPGHPKEADIRFELLEEMANHPFSEADLVGGVIGAVTRLPKDPRGISGLLMVARRLEELELYELAETYYRLTVLLNTMQQTRDVEGKSAEALLGQARVMAAQGKLAEADTLLRVINTNVRWAHLWSTSGPLWATLAFRQGQYREGIRRWRHTCGPPGGELLPRLFELLVPDLAGLSAPADGTMPRKPGVMPQELVELAVTAVLEQLLAANDYDGTERLLALVEKDPDWGGQLPLNKYRTRVLERLVEHESTARAFEWLKQHPIQVSAEAAPEAPELAKWVEGVEDVVRRVQSLRY